MTPNNNIIINIIILYCIALHCIVLYYNNIISVHFSVLQVREIGWCTAEAHFRLGWNECGYY